jgi:hypothetical protein
MHLFSLERQTTHVVVALRPPNAPFAHLAPQLINRPLASSIQDCHLHEGSRA